MTLTSYAQNFEDILLWRALKNIKKGIYIDIGAQDPEFDSVSLSFYQKGWRGIHIEPNEDYFNRLKIARPDEIVEQLAISDKKGPIPFYEIPFTGLSTADFSIAKKHKANGFNFIKKEVKTASLDFIFNKHSLGEVHWLKIDVEGFEKSVLDSWKNSECRPWIILIEATEPLTQIDTYSSYEDILFSKNYQFVYFDGLNRFYIHKDHIELAEHFRIPINIFDNFITAKAKESEAKAKESEAKAKESEAKAKESEAKLCAIYRSKSWRITAPLRVAIQSFKPLLNLSKNIKAAIKTKIKLSLAHANLFVDQRPRFRKTLLSLLAGFPALKDYLKSEINTNLKDPLTDLENLSTSARKIYDDLKFAIQRRQKDNN